MSKAAISRLTLAACWGLALLIPGPALAAWSGDPLVNLPVCTAGGSQEFPEAVSDGAGGAIVTWRDSRPGIGTIFVQRILAGGTVAWTAQGAPMGPSYYGNALPTITSDGSGGAIVAWFDWRGVDGAIYAQHIAGDGTVLWAADGVALGTAGYDMATCVAVPDGAGGAFVAWRAMRDGLPSIVLQHISFEGAVQWMAEGFLVAIAETLNLPDMISDGAGGAILAWQQGATVADPMLMGWDVHAARILPFGMHAWGPMPVTFADGEQVSPTLVSDGAGGAVITWMDLRDGESDIYAQRIMEGGEPFWLYDGVPVCTTFGHEDSPAIATDGAGGAVITWRDGRGLDLDIYAQRLSQYGEAQWTPDGQAVGIIAGNEAFPAIATDGAGGAIVTWVDIDNGQGDIYARRITADGAPQGPAAGVALCLAPGDQSHPSLATDGAGGVIVAWHDSRNGGLDIYAQRLTHVGALGSEPVVAHVADIPNDQGGRVKLSWYASASDASPDYGVGSYWIWRSVPPNYVAAAMALGARLFVADEKSQPTAGSTLTTTVEGDKTIFWEYVGSQYAAGDAGYSYVVPTTSDSLAGSNPLTLVRVQARASLGNGFWNSPTASGYSVDNLAPTQPLAFTGNYLGVYTTLHWQPSIAPDLAGYRVYRGASADFTPDGSTFVVAKADTGFVDAVAGSSFYKLCAEDIHGNLSTFALLSPQFASGVSGVLPGVAVLSQNAPNPFNPRTTIRFSLPAGGHARLSIYDVSGRLVRTLVDGTLDGGDHEIIWDGSDAGGRAMASGSYLARLESGATVRAVRMALVR
jgi:hypothetical protein